MNAVEIEEAVSKLADEPFDPDTFPFAFLEAFGNKETTIKRLKNGTSNQSDLPGGVLQRSNIHLKTCPEGTVTATLAALRQSPATARHKAKFILATDGKTFEAENIADGDPLIVCPYSEFPDHFGYFLPLAGITTVKQIRENSFDIKATGRLNRLYVELLKDNRDWDTAARREDLNHFMARLIFCFFAEDTAIFGREVRFTETVERMSARDSSNTHEVLSELFRAMNTRLADRQAADMRSWASVFPYVNGGLFSGSVEVPSFSKIARSYLIHVGNLDWTKINPDIFGSMIQAVADDEERGALGMHYTSVPNILKVLNPLCLDELRARLEEAGDNARKLLNLRQRIARIRVFDPACGSGNFLVIAYKEMRAIEAEINRRRGENERKSDIPKTNFRGIEMRHFSAEIARLALIIAEYQCDVLYRGQQLALAEFLPLEAANWITCGNALRLDWLSICPATSKGVKNRAEDLFETPLDQAEIDFENDGGETYICGNPPYTGSRRQQDEQKADLARLFAGKIKKWKSLDYVAGWFFKASEYSEVQGCRLAFVSTSSMVEGLQVSLIWPLILSNARKIFFAHRSFKWSNLAKNNAGVSVVIVGVAGLSDRLPSKIFADDNSRIVDRINPYLVSAPVVYVEPRPSALDQLPRMVMGSMPRDGGHLILDRSEATQFQKRVPAASGWIRKYLGSYELIHSIQRYCLWIEDEDAINASQIPEVRERMNAVAEMRSASPLESTNEFADRPYRFVYLAGRSRLRTVAVSGVSSENRRYIPVDLLPPQVVVSNLAFAIYDAPIWSLAMIASSLHLAWVATVCGKMKTDYRYSATLGWNTFPVPTLTEQNKIDLTRCAEDILLAREAHFPATIADLYDPENMPTDLREAHDRNDETLERIYIGRRFKNDTERLEKLFELYTQMSARQTSVKKPTPRKTQARYV